MTNIFAEEHTAQLLKKAGDARVQFDRANQELADAMLVWIQKQLPAGTVIDLRHSRKNPLPEYLRDVRVLFGNSRGTKLFRIEKIRHVDPDTRHPSLSAWFADATPISMTTGKPMSGVAGNTRSGRTLLDLKGSFDCGDFKEETNETEQKSD